MFLVTLHCTIVGPSSHDVKYVDGEMSIYGVGGQPVRVLSPNSCIQVYSGSFSDY